MHTMATHLQYFEYNEERINEKSIKWKSMPQKPYNRTLHPNSLHELFV